MLLECQIDYYGKNCRHLCSAHCYVTSRCNRFTGGVTVDKNQAGQETHANKVSWSFKNLYLKIDICSALQI